jgi:deoxyribonuclease V
MQMKLAVDVNYDNCTATVGGIVFRKWADALPYTELVSHINQVHDYEPGVFYKRELPPILKLLHEHHLQPECIVIDGYVYLDGYSAPGLGKYLYDSQNGETPVIGVAKKRYQDISSDFKVYRGKSKKPLYVTVAGMPFETAKDNIIRMDGKTRIPTLLKRVDQLCRGIQH